MIYIASPFFTPPQVAFVIDIEERLTQAQMRFFSPRKSGVLLDMNEEERQASKAEIFKANIDNIDGATHVVAVIDDRDVGTMWEMGYAFAKAKPVISISNQSYGLNIMLAESVQAHVTELVDMMEAILNPGFSGDIVRGIY
jgi:nucleoside 2-deoxyribosyltransferase